MPRRTFDYGTYHVYNRGLNKMVIFKNKNDYERFYKLLLKNLNKEKYRYIKIVSYCFLPNHFHFIISNPGVELSWFMRDFQNAYSKYFNIRNNRKGQLFEGRFKAKKIEDEKYLAQCVSYVNLNAIKHNIVDNIEDYKWTSYHQIAIKSDINKYNDFILDELEI